ncbi:MAG: bifunctional folylpolyglutamate synthase/dihydrofolate synthase [Candidatus Hydrogenedentes bacterium]|nr:bifunctional folylpolyglutamate synthase/dihydrofolate synthase [Candidatus Hydrogenedentota bacterium]
MVLIVDTKKTDPRAYLESLILHGIKLGLQNINALMDASGQPHKARPVIHVAGTNGKGSVLAFLSSILQCAGYRVGRFTSPHLLDVTERFLINGVPMNEEALCENVAWFKEVAATIGQVPTFFEMNTAIAFRWFDQQDVDVSLIEVGMGGRFDSTNIVSPLASAITNIDFDHMQFLGDSLAAIAYEKAGILKANVPAVIGVTDPSALKAIEKQGQVVGAPLRLLDKEYHVCAGGSPWNPTLDYRSGETSFQNLSLGLAGRHQPHNAAIAVELALQMQEQFPQICEAAIREGLRIVRWPGRLEQVYDNPPIIMDAAHNVAGCRAAMDALGKKCVMIFSVSADKEASAMAKILSQWADPLIITAYGGGRSLPLADLSGCLGDLSTRPCSSMSEALDEGLRLASQEKPLLIVGSIYGAGEARRLLMERFEVAPVRFA